MVDPLRRLFPLHNIDLRRPARIDTGGTWALRFPESPHVRFGALVSGTCWLTASGAAPTKLEAGDGYLLTRGQSFSVGSEPYLPAEDALALEPKGYAGGQIQYGEHRGTSLVSGRFNFDELTNEFLLEILPPVVHLSGDGPGATSLRAAIEIVDYETSNQGFGASLVTHHVAQIMLVQSLRNVINTPGHPPIGWLAGLADQRIGLAMELMYEEVEKRWTVADFAKQVGMSRSLFARRFKDLTGSSPLDYLLGIRMRLASEALRTTRRGIATIGYDVGYQSESAFSVAFKRFTGFSPSEIRKTGELPEED